MPTLGTPGSVNDVISAVAVACLVGGQEDDHPGNLVDPADATHWRTGGQPWARVVSDEVGIDHGTVNGAWQNRVDPDLLRSQLNCQRPADAARGELAGHVREQAGISDPAV